MRTSIQLGLIAASVVVLAYCSDPTSVRRGLGNAAGSPGAASASSAKMATLARYNDGGCGASINDSSGVRHGYAIQRRNLPFAVPAVQHDAKTGHGNATVVHFSVSQPGSAPVAFTCWLPNTESAADLLTAMQQASKNGRWKALFGMLPKAPVIPDSAHRHALSAEVQAFAATMLASRPAPTGASNSVHSNFDSGCLDVHGTFDWYSDIEQAWLIIDVDIEVCDPDDGGGDIFEYVIDSGYSAGPYVVVDADKYNITDLDSVSFSAEVVSDGHEPPVGWTWVPGGGLAWDPWTDSSVRQACLGTVPSCKIQVHGTGTMFYVVDDATTGDSLSGQLQIIASLPPDAGADSGDAPLPSNWDSGGASSTPISVLQLTKILQAADSSDEHFTWVYTQNCAQCDSAGIHGPFTEHVVDIPNHYGDCTDFVWAMVTKVLGASWNHQKINTAMFDTLDAPHLAAHGYAEDVSGNPIAGEAIVRGKTSGTRSGHAGIFSGWCAGSPHHPCGMAENGTPATYYAAGTSKGLGLRDFGPLTGYATRFFRPQTP